MWKLLLCLTVGAFFAANATAERATVDDKSTSKFVDGPVLVNVSTGNPKVEVEVCFARIEEKPGEAPVVLTSLAPVKRSCPDKEKFYSDEQSELNSVIEAEVNGSLKELVKFAGEEAEWKLKSQPHMFYVLTKKNEKDEGIWVSFCQMTFKPANVKKGEKSETKDIFCEREPLDAKDERQLCPSPSKCLKAPFVVAKPERIIGSSLNAVHAEGDDH